MVNIHHILAFDFSPSRNVKMLGDVYNASEGSGEVIGPPTPLDNGLHLTNERIWYS